jgi:hypothetical protein
MPTDLDTAGAVNGRKSMTSGAAVPVPGLLLLLLLLIVVAVHVAVEL